MLSTKTIMLEQSLWVSCECKILNMHNSLIIRKRHNQIEAPADSRKREGQKPSLFAWIDIDNPSKPPLERGGLSLCSDNLPNVCAMLGFRVRILPNSCGYALCNAIKSTAIRCNPPLPENTIPNAERKVWPTFTFFKKGYDFSQKHLRVPKCDVMFAAYKTLWHSVLHYSEKLYM